MDDINYLSTIALAKVYSDFSRSRTHLRLVRSLDVSTDFKVETINGQSTKVLVESGHFVLNGPFDYRYDFDFKTGRLSLKVDIVKGVPSPYELEDIDDECDFDDFFACQVFTKTYSRRDLTSSKSVVTTRLESDEWYILKLSTKIIFRVVEILTMYGFNLDYAPRKLSFLNVSFMVNKDVTILVSTDINSLGHDNLYLVTPKVEVKATNYNVRYEAFNEEETKAHLI